MTFDPQKVLQSKRAMRRELAARPIAEKLAMLDALRERALALRAATKMPVDGNIERAELGDNSSRIFNL